MSRESGQWVLALTGLAAESAVVTQLTGRRQPIRRVTDIVELMAVAQPAISERVLVAPRFPQMSREIAFRLAADGMPVWGLLDPGDDPGERTLRDWGIPVVAATADLRDLPVEGRPPAPRSRSRGVVVAVSGPAGAPGRSTVALNLAARWGSEALLVDADSKAPSLGFMLGLPSDAPGVRGASREAGSGRLDETQLWAAGHSVHGLTVLPGAVGSLPDGGADRLIDLCSRAARVTVVDCGGPQPGTLGRAALDRADCVIDVALPTSLGIRRWIEHLTDTDIRRGLLIVWNQLDRGRDAASLRALADLTHDAVPGAVIAGLPWDRRIDAAAGPLRTGRLHRAITSLADGVSHSWVRHPVGTR